MKDRAYTVYSPDDIRALRWCNGWTQQDLANVMNVVVRSVARWEASRDSAKGGPPSRLAAARIGELIQQCRQRKEERQDVPEHAAAS